MFTALIAEDSKPILRNIKALLQSTELPISVVATASNGEEALECLRSQPVDIMLTDIRMPRMDGLTLIEEAKRLHPQLKVVLISGYNDFEYTRKALNLQVFDYLLKPVERHQLMDVMERLIGQLNESQVSDTGMLKEILDAQYRSGVKLGTEFREQAHCPLILRMQPFTSGTGNWKTETLQHCLEEICAPHASWVFPTQTPLQALVLVHASVREKFGSFLDWMNAVRQRLANAGLEVSAGGQLQPLEPGELPDLYRRISRQLDERLALDEPILLDANLLPRTPIEEQSDDAEKKAIMGSFLEMIRQRQRERFLLKLSEQLHRWRQENIRVAELERFLAMMADTFGEQLSDHDPWSRLKQAEAVGKLMSSASYASFCEELLAWAGEGFELMQAQNKKSSQELFQQIDDYVQMNMYSHLSITDLALKFHVSPSYISRIIKRHSDQTFVHYYMQLKIKEARRLMEDKPELKIKELSDALSFSDQHYFSKVFKEYTGCSPTEYKERLRDEEDQKKPLGE